MEYKDIFFNIFAIIGFAFCLVCLILYILDYRQRKRIKETQFEETVAKTRYIFANIDEIFKLHKKILEEIKKDETK